MRRTRWPPPSWRGTAGRGGGREELASGVERMRLCLEEFGPALCSAFRATLPDPADPGQVAAYLHFHAAWLSVDHPKRRGLLARLTADVSRTYPGAHTIAGPAARASF